MIVNQPLICKEILASRLFGKQIKQVLSSIHHLVKCLFLKVNGSPPSPNFVPFSLIDRNITSFVSDSWQIPSKYMAIPDNTFTIKNTIQYLINLLLVCIIGYQQNTKFLCQYDSSIIILLSQCGTDSFVSVKYYHVTNSGKCSEKS